MSTEGVLTNSNGDKQGNKSVMAATDKFTETSDLPYVEQENVGDLENQIIYTLIHLTQLSTNEQHGVINGFIDSFYDSFIYCQ